MQRNRFFVPHFFLFFKPDTTCINFRQYIKEVHVTLCVKTQRQWPRLGCCIALARHRAYSALSQKRTTASPCTQCTLCRCFASRRAQRRHATPGSFALISSSSKATSAANPLVWPESVGAWSALFYRLPAPPSPVVSLQYQQQQAAVLTAAPSQLSVWLTTHYDHIWGFMSQNYPSQISLLCNNELRNRENEGRFVIQFF